MNYFLLDQYNLVLIRYGEVWLKSQKVKIRMLKYLMSNIKNMLLKKEIPFHKYQLSKDSSRVFFFFDNKDLGSALEVIQKAFGVHSYSPALRTSNKLENITERTIEVGKEIFSVGDSFALRVKRSGTHEYSSLDVAQIVGKEVIEHFKDYNLKVNLSNPNKKIFIEIRDDFSYIFTDIYETPWGGLPIEPRKNVLVMDVGRVEDIISGFLLMRRGSKIHPILFDMCANDKNFKDWLENWKRLLDYIPYKNFRLLKLRFTTVFDLIISKLEQKEYICAICRLLRYNIISIITQSNIFREVNEARALTDGLTLNNSSYCTDIIDLQSIALNYLFSSYPIFTPVVSFSETQINSIEDKISTKFKKFDYCKYKPHDQEFDIEKVKQIFEDLAIDTILDGLPPIIEVISLNE